MVTKVITSQFDAKELQVLAESLVQHGMNEEFTPNGIVQHNNRCQTKPSQFGKFICMWQKRGWLCFIAGIALMLIGNLFGYNGTAASLILSFIIETTRSIAFAGGLIWFFTWLLFWQAPLKHCDLCRRLFCRDVILELPIEGTSVNTHEDRTIQQVLRDNHGNRIGTINETVNVAVKREVHYTVYQCKKCGRRKIELIVNTYDR